MANRKDTSPIRLNPKIIDFCSIMKRRDSDGKVNLVSDFCSHENLSYLNWNVWESISDESPLNLMEGFQGPNHQEALLGEKIDGMVDWLRQDPEQLNMLLKCGKTVFITYCGTLQTIMNMPYERREGFTMYAVRFRNIVFLSEDKRRDNSREDKDEYMGEKMEHLVLSTDPDPNVRPDPSELVPSSKEFCPIFQIDLGNSLLIYGAQLDGILRTELVQGNKSEVIEILNNSTLFELKTAHSLTKFKTLKMYRQATLSKCEQILVVYKNGPNGHAGRKDIIRTNDLPRNQSWDAKKLVQSLRVQTSFIGSESRKEPDLACTFKFTWRPRQKHPKCSPISHDRDTYKLLPDDFMVFLTDAGRALGSPNKKTSNAPPLSWKPSPKMAPKRRRWNDENVWGRGNQRRREEFAYYTNTRGPKSTSPSEEYRRFGGSYNARLEKPWRVRSPLTAKGCNQLAPESSCEPDEKPRRYICSPRDCSYRGYNPFSNELRTTSKFQKPTEAFQTVRRERRIGNNRMARSCEQTAEVQKWNNDRPPVNNPPRNQYWFRMNRGPQESENRSPRDRGVNQDRRSRGHFL